MQDEQIILEGIYLIGGPNISRSEDATAFVVDCGDELVMIDSGAGRSVEIMEKNIRELGLDTQKISTLILTHCHIDHIGDKLSVHGRRAIVEAARDQGILT